MNFEEYKDKTFKDNPEVKKEYDRLKAKDLYIIAVDFDGTLCENHYPEIGPMNHELIERIKVLQSAGIKFILWTCRAGTLLDEAIKACQNEGIFFDAINDNLPEHKLLYPYSGRKITANEYWDDKSADIGVAVWVDDSMDIRCTNCKSAFNNDIINVVKPLRRCPCCGKLINYYSRNLG